MTRFRSERERQIFLQMANTWLEAAALAAAVKEKAISLLNSLKAKYPKTNSARLRTWTDGVRNRRRYRARF